MTNVNNPATMIIDAKTKVPSKGKNTSANRRNARLIVTDAPKKRSDIAIIPSVVTAKERKSTNATNNSVDGAVAGAAGVSVRSGCRAKMKKYMIELMIEDGATMSSNCVHISR